MKLYINDDYPSTVKVYFDNEFQRQELKKFLTIKVPGAEHTYKYRSKQWDGTHCFYNRFNETFPVGFLGRVLRQFPGTVLVDKRTYTDVSFHIPKLQGLNLRMYQKEAILWAFEHRNCIIQAATNSGKSAIIAGLLQLLRHERALILVHRVELLRQLRKMIMGWTGYNVGFVTAEEVELDEHINIAMVMTLLSRIATDATIKDMFLKSRVLITDEVHHSRSDTYAAVLQRSKAIYRFGFSGTVPDEDTYDGWLCRQYIGDVVFNVTNKELIEQGISAEPKIVMIGFQHSVDYQGVVADIRRENAEKNIKYRTPWEERQAVYKAVFQRVLREHIVLNAARNQLIVDVVCRELRGRQTLIVVDYLEHGRLLYDMIVAYEKKDTASYIYGQSKSRKGDLLAFRDAEIRVLISTSIVDEGIDISMIQTLVLAGGRKSKRQILQRVGRGLRRKPGENVVYVIDFFDYDKKYLEKHSKERLKIYHREGFDVQVLPPGTASVASYLSGTAT